jgi:hypothetical protein
LSEATDSHTAEASVSGDSSVSEDISAERLSVAKLPALVILQVADKLANNPSFLPRRALDVDMEADKLEDKLSTVIYVRFADPMLPELVRSAKTYSAGVNSAFVITPMEDMEAVSASSVVKLADVKSPKPLKDADLFITRVICAAVISPDPVIGLIRKVRAVNEPDIFPSPFKLDPKFTLPNIVAELMSPVPVRLVVIINNLDIAAVFDIDPDREAVIFTPRLAFAVVISATIFSYEPKPPASCGGTQELPIAYPLGTLLNFLKVRNIFLFAPDLLKADRSPDTDVPAKNFPGDLFITL